jgi:hypothetical protein
MDGADMDGVGGMDDALEPSLLAAARDLRGQMRPTKPLT